MQLPKDARDIVVDFLHFAGQSKEKANLTISRRVDGKNYSFDLSEDELRYMLFDWFETRKEQQNGNHS